MPERPTLAVVGGTGAVGRTVLSLLRLREDLWGEVRVCASPDDVGTTVVARGEELVVQRLSRDFFDGVDIALFDLPPQLARTWAPIAVAAGAIVIDNSTDFREEHDVPLVASSVNPLKLRDRPRGIIANPGATALTILEALGVLHTQWDLGELVLTTFQAASGLGRRGTQRLYDEMALVGADRTLGRSPGDVRRLVEHELGPSPFPAPLAYNVVPFVGVGSEDGATSEETKVRGEIRKVLELPRLPISATCVRVPVVTSHSVAVHARFERRLTADDVRQALMDAPTIVVLDDIEHHEFPTPVDAVGSDPRFVGRIRQTPGLRNAIDFFICSDNLRTGGALNLVENAELVRPELHRG
ncbi:Aspartate-semialdehyde dehydrogenase, USG-1 related [Nostocoides japonicum T1-X7]|uniref:aspartate-semialdehyde dehydrogenase n=1 Tax=Nostocoides japonicum T1-X7 TaxID=1194083 RepID=A0A077M1V7_9MICO|nr:aspartate-semialdehyde dehydrogenase [Tetrasphaera japonica]CCH78194.1 Aspartate-semialdehyde dehydrogenase, USG-1 related [Tetrasphaera japonica T1-X7]